MTQRRNVACIEGAGVAGLEPGVRGMGTGEWLAGELLEHGVLVLQRVHRRVKVHSDDEGVRVGLGGETFASEGRALDC